jgi:CBS domain-containing protein
VKEHLGSVTRVLQSGVYTIKPNSPVFEAFEITIKNGKKTVINNVGTLELNWPSDDFWKIYRGNTVVKEHLGSITRALQPGVYTVKPNDPVFEAFEITIKNGKRTVINNVGILEFNWPSDDFWKIYRGDTVVKEHLGSITRALQPGVYTIKANDPVFEAFEVTIKNGKKTTVKK